VEVLAREEVALLALAHRAHKTSTGWRLLVRLLLDAPRAFREEAWLRLLPENFPGEAWEKEASLEGEAGRAWREVVWDLPEMPLWEVWERGFPHLFRLEAQLAGASLAVPLGFRTVEVDGEGWLLLNGSRLFLRGTNIIPTQWLSAYGEEVAQRDVALLKEANLNAVRVHAHVTHPAFYRACDREGVLVWQDFPLQWGYAPDEAFAREALRQARAMVEILGAHPSIYLWCAQNEPTHNRHTLGPLLLAAIREADPTRPVKAASDFREHPYPGWYWGHYRDFLALPGAPLPSEFGAQALPRAELLRRVLGEAAWPPRWEVWAYHNFQPHETFRVAGVEVGESLEAFVESSQAYQARLLEFAIHAYRRAKGKVVGYFQFMFVEPWGGDHLGGFGRGAGAQKGLSRPQGGQQPRPPLPGALPGAPGGRRAAFHGGLAGERPAPAPQASGGPLAGGRGEG
jgi:beta-mannosidase